MPSERIADPLSDFHELRELRDRLESKSANGAGSRVLTVNQLLAFLWDLPDEEFERVDPLFDSPSDPGPHEPLTLDNTSPGLVADLRRLVDAYGLAGVRSTLDLIANAD